MDIIIPHTFDYSRVWGSSILEDNRSYNEWAAGTTYGDGDYVIVAADHKVYESLQAANTGHAPSSSPTWWLDLGATNRYMPFDGYINTQTYVVDDLCWALDTFTLTDDNIVDSVSLHNIRADTVQVVQAELTSNAILNNTEWTGATGATPPNSWDAVGSPSFDIDTNTIKITATAAGDGMKQTVAAVAGTEYQLIGKYRNTAGDYAQYRIVANVEEPVTDQTDNIVVNQNGDTVYLSAQSAIDLTDLSSRVGDLCLFSAVFTAPAGCTSVTVYLTAKNAGDIVWFDSIYLMETDYNETQTTRETITTANYATYFRNPIAKTLYTYKTDVVFTDIPAKSPAFSYYPIITIFLTGSSCYCGEIVYGNKFEIGAMRYSPTISITDYSMKTVDTYGNVSITERTYAKRLNCRMMIYNTIFDEVARRLALYRSTALVWVGSTDYTSLIVYGYYKSFDITVPYLEFSECSLEIEGMI